VKLWNVLCPAKWNRSVSRILFSDLKSKLLNSDSGFEKEDLKFEILDFKSEWRSFI